jgi:hypothetical protein
MFGSHFKHMSRTNMLRQTVSKYMCQSQCKAIPEHVWSTFQAHFKNILVVLPSFKIHIPITLKAILEHVWSTFAWYVFRQLKKNKKKQKLIHHILRGWPSHNFFLKHPCIAITKDLEPATYFKSAWWLIQFFLEMLQKYHCFHITNDLEPMPRILKLLQKWSRNVWQLLM